MFGYTFFLIIKKFTRYFLVEDKNNYSIAVYILTYGTYRRLHHMYAILSI